MLPYKRSQRVSHQLKKEIADIIGSRVKDPRIGFLTVTDADVTSDLKLARIYISIMNENEQKPTLEALESAKSFIRAELNKRMRMKTIPALEFKLDTTIEYGTKIEKLLRDIRR